MGDGKMSMNESPTNREVLQEQILEQAGGPAELGSDDRLQDPVGSQEGRRGQRYGLFRVLCTGTRHPPGAGQGDE